jgi:alkaline phosphatase
MASSPVTLDFSKAQSLQLDFSKAQSIGNDPQAAIKAKYGLPPETDLTQGYFSDKNSGIKGLNDPMAFSKAYAEVNPPPPEAKGFLANMWGEAKNIYNSIGPGTGQSTASAPEIPGAGAVDLAKSRYEQAKTDLPGALGKTATDALAVAAPIAIAKGIDAIPSAERAGVNFQNLSETIGDHPVGISDDLSQSLNALRKASTTTNTSIPPVVRKLMDRVDSFHGMGPLTYDEARAFSSEINQLSAADKMSLTPNTKRLIGGLNASLKDAVQDTADMAGKGEQLSSAMKEYRNAMKMRNLSDVAKDELWKAILGGVGVYGAKKIWDATGTGGKQ